METVYLQWASKNRKNKHSLHPTFTHGSTLGLYEVLIGKPYFCDMITDSVAVCFFVEAEKILSALGSDSAVEHFFWKVCPCAIFLSQIVSSEFTEPE